MKNIIVSIICVICVTVGVVSITMMTDRILEFKSQDQKIQQQYEIELKHKAVQVLERLFDKKQFEVIVNVALETKERKEERFVQKPNKRVLKEERSSRIEDKGNVPRELTKKEKRRDLKQPGFADIMPEKQRYKRWLGTQMKKKERNKQHVNKTDNTIEEVFVDTVKSEVLRPKNTIIKRQVLILLNKGLSHEMNTQELTRVLRNAMGLNINKGDELVIKKTTIITKLSVFEKAKAWVLVNKGFCMVVGGGLLILLFFYEGFKLPMMYLKKLLSPKEKESDVDKEEEPVEKPLTQEEKKEKLIELAKTEPEKLKELLDLWVS